MMTTVLDLFSIGIGPSSSHTVGPMRAGADFVEQLISQSFLELTSSISVDTFGSLAATGDGHATFGAILLGLEGNLPEEIDPLYAQHRITEINTLGILELGAKNPIQFSTEKIGKYPSTVKTRHPNALSISAYDENQHLLYSEEYYSIGGGSIEKSTSIPRSHTEISVPYPFYTAQELLTYAETSQLSISEIVWENELTMHDATALREGILERWNIMSACIEHGFTTEGLLPGGLFVRRRAPQLYQRITQSRAVGKIIDEMDWLNLAAIAVNEENAAGGRVVTAPTNGAAGIFPAVLYYALHILSFPDSATQEEAIIRFFLTATAIGHIVKFNASFSGAEVGCQGEVGVACSMAAAAFAEMMLATPAQVENAAEIAIEHNLGLTCDPIRGLVQIPCIERNAVGAVKAVNAARLASYGDGKHYVSLDTVIETLRITGQDMNSKYKETALGGLAITVVPVNYIQC